MGKMRTKRKAFDNIKPLLTFTSLIFMVGWAVTYFQIFWVVNQKFGISCYIACALESLLVCLIFLFILFRIWRKIVAQIHQRPRDSVPKGKDIPVALRKIQFMFAFIIIWFIARDDITLLLEFFE